MGKVSCEKHHYVFLLPSRLVVTRRYCPTANSPVLCRSEVAPSHAATSPPRLGTGLFFAKFFAKNRGVLGKTKKTKKTRKIGGYFSEKYWRGIFSWRKKRENLFFVVFGVEMRFITVFCTSMPTVSSLKQLNKPETDRQYREEEDNEHQNLRSLNQILLFI